MLAELRVRNLALIASAALELGPGLTVLSGETGAGKTALLSSLKLLVGERGDAGVVGTECDETRIEALFTNGAEEHLVVRRINSEGRSRCYLDDSLVTVGKLSEILGPSVDLYGQHEHQSLLRPAEQLRILDEYAAETVGPALGSYHTFLQEFREARVELDNLEAFNNSSSAEREQAAFTKREIAKIAPRLGEYESLELELPRLQHGEQLGEATHAVLELLRGEGGVLERLKAASRTLESLRRIDAQLDEPLEQLVSFLIGLEELAADLGRYAWGIDFDPQALQRTLDRLGELDSLRRRFGPGMDQVFFQLERSEQLLLSTEDTAERINAAKQKLGKAEQDLKDAATELSQVRKVAAQGFITELNDSLLDLALAGASLEFSVEDLPFERWSVSGPSSYELLYRPAPDATARPLARIASGGELSRVMLAIKSLLQSSQHSMTLVFDEIDAGIGGKTAHAVAERLAKLAKSHQIIVITHLAQIAVLANQHFLVDKRSENGTTCTTIVALGESERVREIARMLSGSSNQEALAHAQKMLREAQR